MHYKASCVSDLILCNRFDFWTYNCDVVFASWWLNDTFTAEMPTTYYICQSPERVWSPPPKHFLLIIYIFYAYILHFSSLHARFYANQLGSGGENDHFCKNDWFLPVFLSRKEHFKKMTVLFWNHCRHGDRVLPIWGVIINSAPLPF